MPMLRAKCCILSERLNTKFYLPSERRLSSSARRSASLTRFRENPDLDDEHLIETVYYFHSIVLSDV